MTSPTHRTTNVLRWVALVGTLASIATLEYLAGEAAGWGAIRSAGIPLGIDAFVMAVLLAPRSSGFDRLAALALMEFTVVVSAVAGDHEQAAGGKQPNVALGAVLATALVFALWRLDETIRADKHHDDQLAEVIGRLAAAERQVGDLREQVSAARAESDRAARALEDERGRHVAEIARLKADRRNADDDGGRDKPGPKAAPSREQARSILMTLPDFEAVTNAELARLHGGTDTFWRGRKADLRTELAELTTEARSL